MKLYRKLELKFRRKAASLSVRYQTYRFDREIKKAYNVSSIALPGLPVRTVVEFAGKHPIVSFGVPLLLLLTLLTLRFGPSPSAVHKPSFQGVRSVVSGISARVHGLFASRPAPAPAEEQVVSIDKTVNKIQGKAAANEFFNALLADKTKKTILVFKYFSDGRYDSVKTYTISIGSQWGRKQKQGDLKTPEGFYWLIGRMEKHELLPLYGRRAFVTNYPNETDIAEKRTGTGIWIHGFDEGTVRDKTKGCIGLANPDLDDLTQHIGIGTPIVITESCSSVADTVKKYFDWKKMLELRASYIQKGRETNSFASNFVERWRVAWQSKDIDEYTGLYAEDFVQDGMDYPQWKEYKRSIFTKPQEITVNVSDVKLMRMSGDTAFIRFTQTYESGAYKTVSGKVLKIVRAGDDWKIKEELRLTVN